MKPTDLVRASQEHQRIIDPMLNQALASLDEWGGLGYPTGGSAGGRSSDTSNPTERVALTALERRTRDSFARDRAQIIADLQTAELALRRVRDTVDRSRPLPTGTGGEPVVKAEPGCEPCSRVCATDQDGRPTRMPHRNNWQSVYCRVDGITDGRVALCSWHYEFFERYGELPAGEIALWHLDHLGRHVPYALVRDRHPEAFARAQAHKARPLGLDRLELRATVEP